MAFDCLRGRKRLDHCGLAPLAWFMPFLIHWEVFQQVLEALANHGTQAKQLAIQGVCLGKFCPTPLLKDIRFITPMSSMHQVRVVCLADRLNMWLDSWAATVPHFWCFGIPK